MITEIIAGAVGFVLFFFLGYLNSRISKLSDTIHKRINSIERDWRNSETCDAIHRGINGDIKEIRDAIKEIKDDLRYLRNKGVN